MGLSRHSVLGLEAAASQTRIYQLLRLQWLHDSRQHISVWSDRGGDTFDSRVGSRHVRLDGPIVWQVGTGRCVFQHGRDDQPHLLAVCTVSVSGHLDRVAKSDEEGFHVLRTTPSRMVLFASSNPVIRDLELFNPEQVGQLIRRQHSHGRIARESPHRT